MTDVVAPKLHGGQWILHGLTEITVVFGRNGTGKSRLLRELRDQARDCRHYASPERGGEITFNPSYMQEEMASATRGTRRQANAAPTYRDESVARIQAFLARRGNVRAADIPVGPEKLEEAMNALLPDFHFAISTEGAAPFRLTRIVGGEEIQAATSLSSGEAAIFALGLDLVTISGIWALEGQAQRILLVDEPDLHLHPDLQQHLASFLVKLVKEFDVQIIAATHSTTLLAALGQHGGSQTTVVYLDPAVEEQITRAFSQALQTLASCLGGHALMGPLFALPLLLVEGDDDYRIWAQAVRHNTLQIAVIPCEGSRIAEYATSLHGMFQAMLPVPSRPLAFVLHDRDEKLAVPERWSTGYVEHLWLACREAENLYLTDAVLSDIGQTWDSAREALEACAPQYGEKASSILSILQQDRMSCDLKSCIGQVEQCIDSQRVDWRSRVGRVLGRGRPGGELAAFLGHDVVNALWQPRGSSAC